MTLCSALYETKNGKSSEDKTDSEVMECIEIDGEDILLLPLEEDDTDAAPAPRIGNVNGSTRKNFYYTKGIYSPAPKRIAQDHAKETQVIDSEPKVIAKSIRPEVSEGAKQEDKENVDRNAGFKKPLQIKGRSPIDTFFPPEYNVLLFM